MRIINMIVALFALTTACISAATTVPVYELYSPGATDFFYTLNPQERDNAISYYGYVDLGVAFAVQDSQNASNAANLRYYAGYPWSEHFYSINPSEQAFVQNNLGFSPEGATGYYFATQQANTVPLYRTFYQDGTGNSMHRVTTDFGLVNAYVSSGWSYDGVVGYVYPAAAGAWSAKFLSVSAPSSIAYNSTANVSLTVQNVGYMNWSTSQQWFLATENPQDGSYWCLGTADRHRVPLPVDVPPLSTYTFNFTVQPGGCFDQNQKPFTFAMLSQNVGTLFDYSPDPGISITAATQPTFVSWNVPTSMSPGQTTQVSITMRNTGSEGTWSEAGHIRLGSFNEMDNLTWGDNRILMSPSASVPAGAQYTFTFNITAPTQLGPHNFQWNMVHDGVRWFGSPTPNQVITVADQSVTSGRNNVTFPGSPPSSWLPKRPMAGQDANFLFIWCNGPDNFWNNPACF